MCTPHTYYAYASTCMHAYVHMYTHIHVYRNGSFFHEMIFSRISQVAFHENIIVNSYESVALLQCYILETISYVANRFVKIKSRMFTKIVICEILYNPVKTAIMECITHVHIHTRACTCKHMHAHKHTHTSTLVCTALRDTRARAHTHTHTHTHTHERNTYLCNFKKLHKSTNAQQCVL